MYNSKLIELIKTFNGNEQKKLLKFIQFKNPSDGKIIVLTEYILKFTPNFTDKELNKESLFKALYPEKDTYNDLLVRRCISRLFVLCEEYIAYMKSQQDEPAKLLALIEYYGDKKLELHFGSALRNWKKMRKKQEVINEQYFFEEFLMEQSVSKHIFQQQDRTVEPQLEQISNNLDAFYLMHKLKVCCTSLNYQVLSSTKYELPMMEQMIDFLQTKWESCHTIVQAYYFALLTLKYPEEEVHFQNLQKVLFENLSEFHPNEQRELFPLAQNYCIQRINKGDKEYLTELLELYKVGLETEVVLENDVLSPLDYKNIVTLGTRLKKYDWTEQFIEKYHAKLQDSFRESAYHYNLARLFFSKKEFEKVIDLLRQVEHREIFVDLAAKVLLLKTYYELDEIEPLMSLTESFRMFLSRKKNLGYHKDRYQKFLKFLRRLLRLQIANESEKEEFREAVQNTKELIEKEWFLEKIES